MTKQKARCYGQDLMRGEHVVGGGKVSDKGKAFKSQSRLTALAKTGNSKLKPNKDLPEDQQRALGGYMANGAVIDRAEGNITGTSIFDPVLCELVYRWFCPKGGRILDPFAGGSVRGIVASKLGYEYIGIELRAEQVKANQEQAQQMELSSCWVLGDSHNAADIAKGEYDLIFSCPPYYDLEVYSEQQGELSAMPTYQEFLINYGEIISQCVGMLKDDRFACFVVGDIRDKFGFYHNFVSDTIAAFQNAGAMLYNEAILVTAVGSLPIRVGRAFQSNRKLGKTHQNVLIFYKGNPKNIKGIYGDVECGDEEDFTGRKAELSDG